jgi:hypothetical protein
MKLLSAKAEIMKKLDKGEKLINLAKEYGVVCAMIFFSCNLAVPWYHICRITKIVLYLY